MNTETASYIENLQNQINELETNLEYLQNKCELQESVEMKREDTFNFDCFDWWRLELTNGCTIIVAQDHLDPKTYDHFNENYCKNTTLGRFYQIFY